MIQFYFLKIQSDKDLRAVIKKYIYIYIYRQPLLDHLKKISNKLGQRSRPLNPKINCFVIFQYFKFSMKFDERFMNVVINDAGLKIRSRRYFTKISLSCQQR